MEKNKTQLNPAYRWWGVLLMFIGAVCFSTKAIIVKLTYLGVADSVTILSLRMLFSAPFFAIVLLYPYLKPGASRPTPLTRQEIIWLLVMGVVGYYLSSLFDFWGLEYLSASLERLILYIYPTLTVVIGAFLFRRPITRIEIAALFITYTGVAVVFLFGQQAGVSGTFIGATLVFMSAVTYAFYLAGSQSLIGKLGSLRYTSLVMLVSSVAVLAHYFASGRSSLFSLDAHTYSLCLLMAVLSTVIPSFAVSEGIRRLGSGPAAIIASIGPVSTIILAHYYLHEALDMAEIIGTCIVICGVLLISLKGKK